MPAVTTFVASLALGVEKGVLVGVLVDVLILLYFNARPEVSIEVSVFMFDKTTAG